MKNPKAKGNSFERQVCVDLSLWLSNDTDKDWFNRGVTSGGRFTHSERKGSVLGDPGDVIAAKPQAYAFTDVFLVECKHRASIGLEQLFYHARGGFIGDTYAQAAAQALRSKRRPFVIAKQNNREPLLFVDELTAWSLSGASKRVQLTWHKMQGDLICCTMWMPIKSLVPAQKFLGIIKTEIERK